MMEARSEGIAVVDLDDYLTDLPFPAGSTVARMALAPPWLRSLEAATPAAEGRYLVTTGLVRDVCVGLRERYPAAWGKDEVSNVERLTARVTDMLAQAGLACRVGDAEVLLSPAASRWQPQAEEKKASAELTVGLGGELFLFDDDGGSYAP